MQHSTLPYADAAIWYAALLHLHPNIASATPYRIHRHWHSRYNGVNTGHSHHLIAVHVAQRIY